MYYSTYKCERLHYVTFWVVIKPESPLALLSGTEYEYGGMNMKKMYQIPDLQVVLMDRVDIVTSSDEIGPIDDESIGDFAIFG